MTGFLLALAAVFLGGMAISVQAPINAALANAAGDGVVAAAISFLVGFAALLALVLLRGSFPQGETLRQIPPWMWTGGLLGAFYVWAALSSVARLGVLTLAAALILGQLTAALLIDATGAFGLDPRAISWQRLAATVLVAAGLVLSRY